MLNVTDELTENPDISKKEEYTASKYTREEHVLSLKF